MKDNETRNSQAFQTLGERHAAATLTGLLAGYTHVMARYKATTHKAQRQMLAIEALEIERARQQLVNEILGLDRIDYVEDERRMQRHNAALEIARTTQQPVWDDNEPDSMLNPIPPVHPLLND